MILTTSLSPTHIWANQAPAFSELLRRLPFSWGEGSPPSRKNPHLSSKETSQTDHTDRKSAGPVASGLRMGTDCWHVLKSPLNFTELFSPFLAPHRVICLLWLHSALSNSPILRKKVMLYKHSCIAECGGKCLIRPALIPFYLIPACHWEKHWCQGMCIQLPVCFFLNHFIEVWMTVLSSSTPRTWACYFISESNFFTSSFTNAL